VALGRFRLAGLATAEQTTFGDQPWPSRTVNGAIHSASAKQRTVGRVDNRVDRLPGYVSLKDLNLAHDFPAVRKEREFTYPSAFRSATQQNHDVAALRKQRSVVDFAN
jgi:hypothetical protein